MFSFHGGRCAVEICLGVAFERQDGEKFDAFDAIFEKDGRVPESLQTDAGKEFLKKEFQRVLTSKDVRHFVTYNVTKAQIVERFNRTLKNRMWRYFTYKAYHRSIRTAPDRVSDTNAQEVWHRFYGKDFVKRSGQVRLKFKVGDKVRISKKKGPSKKGIYQTGP